MKKVYCYIDKHNGKIIAASKTRRILEEMMMDDFMNSYWWEMNEAVEVHWIDPMNPTEDCKQYAQDVWDSLMRWYKSVYDIQRIELI